MREDGVATAESTEISTGRELPGWVAECIEQATASLV